MSVDAVADSKSRFTVADFPISTVDCDTYPRHSVHGDRVEGENELEYDGDDEKDTFDIDDILFPGVTIDLDE